MALRRVCVLVLILVLAGGVQAGAQDIFLKYDKSKAKEQQEAGGDAPAIYVKPQKLKNSPAGSVNYKDKVYNNQLQKVSKAKMETLEDWRESGLQPKTAEEIRAYANASRAASQNIMYKRRAALMAHLEKKQFKNATMKSSAQQKSAFKIQKDKQPSSASATQKSIYVKPQDKAKSKKVFDQHR